MAQFWERVNFSTPQLPTPADVHLFVHHARPQSVQFVKIAHRTVQVKNGSNKMALYRHVTAGPIAPLAPCPHLGSLKSTGVLVATVACFSCLAAASWAPRSSNPASRQHTHGIGFMALGSDLG
jgi:hypothetical protein